MTSTSSMPTLGREISLQKTSIGPELSESELSPISTPKNFGQEIRLHEVTSERVPSLISAPRTIDAWRHERMFRAARPLVDMFPRDHWQTIGDGGADAWMLREM